MALQCNSVSSITDAGVLAYLKSLMVQLPASSGVRYPQSWSSDDHEQDDCHGILGRPRAAESRGRSPPQDHGSISGPNDMTWKAD